MPRPQAIYYDAVAEPVTVPAVAVPDVDTWWFREVRPVQRPLQTIALSRITVYEDLFAAPAPPDIDQWWQQEVMPPITITSIPKSHLTVTDSFPFITPDMWWQPTIRPVLRPAQLFHIGSLSDLTTFSDLFPVTPDISAWWFQEVLPPVRIVRLHHLAILTELAIDPDTFPPLIGVQFPLTFEIANNGAYTFVLDNNGNYLFTLDNDGNYLFEL